MNAKQAKAIRRAERRFTPKHDAARRRVRKALAKVDLDAVIEFTHDPRDLTRTYLCACGEEIPRPSYSVARDMWVTGRHGTTHIQWLPLKAKSGRVYFKPIRVVEVCDALSDVAAKEEPSGGVEL